MAGLFDRLIKRKRNKQKQEGVSSPPGNNPNIVGPNNRTPGKTEEGKTKLSVDQMANDMRKRNKQMKKVMDDAFK